MKEPFQPPPAFEEFRVLRRLGAGAMGEVFLAEDELLGRRVAIKFVRDAESAATRARFLQEARALARLSHPNVVTVHRVGELLGRPFLVAEWVPGQPLDALELPLPAEQSLAVALQLARALAAAHRAGVLHRDVKPANAVLADSGEVKLVDFGVAGELPAADPQQSSSILEPRPARASALAETQPLPGAAPPTGANGGAAALQVGTPLYAAPELLAGGEASRQSDLYAWGALVYQLCSGRPPHEAQTLDELRARQGAGQIAPLKNVPAALGELVHKCLASAPRDRPAKAEALLDALEPLAAQRAQGAAAVEPYRGLSVFGPEHAALFFGREREARALLDRLRGAAFALVAGDSGVGKSSLCRAGVLPQVAAGALGGQRAFRIVEVSLGAHPAQALAAALAGWLARDERALAADLRSAPEQTAAAVRACAPGEGRLLFVDGLEELCALGPADEAADVARFFAALSVRAAGFRLLATARSDFLTRLSALPALGREVGDALWLLAPLSEEGLRQAIEGPARAAGFHFAPPELVDELLAAARVGPGALPLVQFALAELWRRRDQAAKAIPRDALAAIGGVSGALARHADGVIAALPEDERRAAEQILRRLVTAQSTRARRARGELPAGEAASRALAALTSGRILLARDAPQGEGGATYELAHEALIAGWDQLRAWIGRDAEKRALAQRVELAAEEWRRLGERREGLWSRRQLAELARFRELELGEREQTFLLASRRANFRARALLLAAALTVPAIVAVGLLIARQRAHAEAEAHLQLGAAALLRARAQAAAEAPLARAAFDAFDAGDFTAGEARWAEARTVQARVEQELTVARTAAQTAQVLAPGDEGRKLLASIAAFRLERRPGDPLARERPALLAELTAYDSSGTLKKRFEGPARLQLTTRPPTRATLRSLARPPLPEVALDDATERAVPAGSYVVEFKGGARLPLLLEPGEKLPLDVPLPAEIPEGYIFLPAGKFLSGFEGDEDVRTGFFNAAPLHERLSPAYFIARHELTFAEWLAWLRKLPPAERRKRLPRAETLRNALAVTERADGRFELRMKPTAANYEATAAEGEPLVYPGRKKNRSLDWRQFPVTGISFEDARAYAEWLAASGRVPGAHVCTEAEWERAARGADGRSFPPGDRLAGDDANIDEAYGREPLAFGPDEAGMHPNSDSPVGASDMAGNAWDMTASKAGPILRGGSWYQGALTARSANREPYEPTARDLLIGVRLCVSSP